MLTPCKRALALSIGWLAVPLAAHEYTLLLLTEFPDTEKYERDEHELMEEPELEDTEEVRC